MTHIVLIEDDALLSEMYQNALIAEGYQCGAALDGLNGLRMVQQTKPDLVLLDLMLPQLSGDEVLRLIRNTPECKDVRVLIMTNISESEAPAGLKELGFERYIVKANTTLQEVVGLINDMFRPPQTA